MELKLLLERVSTQLEAPFLSEPEETVLPFARTDPFDDPVEAVVEAHDTVDVVAFGQRDRRRVGETQFLIAFEEFDGVGKGRDGYVEQLVTFEIG